MEIDIDIEIEIEIGLKLDLCFSLLIRRLHGPLYDSVCGGSRSLHCERPYTYADLVPGGLLLTTFDYF